MYLMRFDDELLDIEEVATKLKCDRGTIDGYKRKRFVVRAQRSGQPLFPQGRKVGKKTMWTWAEIVEWLNATEEWEKGNDTKSKAQYA